MSDERVIKQYGKLSRRMEKRFAIRHPKVTGPRLTPGMLTSHQAIEGGVVAQTQNASIELRLIRPNLLAVRVRSDGTFPERHSYALDPEFDPMPPPINIEDVASGIQLDAGAMRVHLDRQTGQLTITLPNGQVASQDAAGGLAWNAAGVSWTRHLPVGERCHGLGERATGLNLRGRLFTLWNTDFIDYQRESDPLYFSIPFYLGVHHDYAIGVLWDNPGRGAVDLGKTTPDRMQFNAKSGDLNFYVIADETPQAVLKSYLELTGKPPLLPMWAFGYHQSRYTYMPSDRYRELATEFRQRQIPCDVLHFDIEYMDQYQIFTWDQQQFNDLPQLLQDLRRKGFKTVAIIDPAVKHAEGNEAFASGQAVDAFHRYPDGELFIAPVWAGESVFPDFTKPATREWWADHVAAFIQRSGFDGLWNDMNEPTLFMPKVIVGTVPDYITADWEGQGSTHHEGAHSVYGMQMARATRTGLERATPAARPFILTRAGYAGAQRYCGTWSGDNTSTWDHLRLSVSMTLQMGLSGMFFTGPDIGGFHGTSNAELYARWIQVGSMLPFCRTHTEKDTPDQEPWSYGPEVEAIARQYLGLRYQLLPYIYSSYTHSIEEGIPLVRPVFFADPQDQKLFEQDDTFMLGDALLVAPVMDAGVRSRDIYLPRGVWYDFWTGKALEGGQTIHVDVPIDRMPLFARAGKLIPMWPLMQYVGEKPVEEIRLRVYVGDGESAFYEDSGEGFGYQQGDYRWAYFTAKHTPEEQRFTLERRIAGDYEPTYTKVRLEIVGVREEPDEILVDDEAAAIWFFETPAIEILTESLQSVRLEGMFEPFEDDADSGAETLQSRSDLS
ncbi:MAG: DUF5110 domain-containing protein [Chloroflexi bacterium]|nr:DUF5110 domain-containing protein [Chloroflexota bacterium]